MLLLQNTGNKCWCLSAINNHNGELSLESKAEAEAGLQGLLVLLEVNL